LAAVVKVIEGELNQERGVVVLTRRTPLMAFNALDASMENCYKRVFAERPLEPGTELKYIGPVEDRKGELAGFKVVAPTGARGYVLPSGVRIATPDEVVKAGGSLAQAPASAPVTQAEPPAGEATPAATTMGQAPEGAAGVGPSADAPAPAKPAAEVKAPADPNDALIDQLNRLEPAFQRVMRSEMEHGEFVDLMESYNGVAQQASINSEGERVRQYADAKIALLQIRADLQKARAEFESAETDSAAAEADLVKLAKLAAEARGYAVVGRLLTSAIYDGTGLPRMFRVQSLERGTSRTVAYVLPNDGLALDSLTGKIVGVRGDSTTEAMPRIPVIRANAVDVLTLEPAQSAGVQDQPN